LGSIFDYLKNKLTLDTGAVPAVIAETAKKMGIDVILLNCTMNVGWRK